MDVDEAVRTKTRANALKYPVTKAAARLAVPPSSTDASAAPAVWNLSKGLEHVLFGRMRGIRSLYGRPEK